MYIINIKDMSPFEAHIFARLKSFEHLLFQTSDEAVSDLSSLSDESGEQKSFEDQIAQAVIAKVSRGAVSE